MGKLRRPRLGKTILVIPDCQVRPGVDVSHMDWIGQYIVDKRPDGIVCLGDFADMPSLSMYSLGKAEAEGNRYVDDIESAKSAMRRLLSPMKRLRRYKPTMHFTLGNHCDRIDREAENNPKLIGKLSVKDLEYERFGWTVHPFLKVLYYEGIQWCHYFTSGALGRPVTSAAALLRTRQGSAIMGHVQASDVAVHQKTQATAIFAGVCALHDEKYLGFQGNDYRRQILMLHEVDGKGRFDLMMVSLSFLRARYS